MKKGIVILSGGMDSTVVATYAKEQGYEIIALHFNYGQRTEHRELQAFHDVCESLEIKMNQRYVVDLPFFSTITTSALIDTSIDVPIQGLSEGIPVTYVPFRNGIFLSIATALAEKENAHTLFIGVVEEDSSGYPDCTDDFMKSFTTSANLGTKPTFSLRIERPLVELKKEDIVALGLKLNAPLEKSWSCYQSNDEACGVCDSCRLRLKGFECAGKKDPISYRMHCS